MTTPTTPPSPALDLEALTQARNACLIAASELIALAHPSLDEAAQLAIGAAATGGGWVCVEAALDAQSRHRVTITVVLADGARRAVAHVACIADAVLVLPESGATH
ncbi:MAG: hypothetical protein ABI699_07910 [Caldimonas sp.]